MRFRFLLMLSLFFAGTIPGYSQTAEYIIISGKVKDKGTGEPLPYATIGIMGTALGIASNELGQFTFNVPKSRLNDSLIISMLGYERFKEPVNDASRKKIFELEQRTLELDEVLITAKGQKMTGDEIWKRARKKQRSNLPDEEYSLSAFFRETYQLNGQYFKLLEAAATIYGHSFPRAKKDVFIDEIRVLKGIEVSLPLSIGENYNPFREFQGTTSRIPNRKACSSCSYEIEEYISNDTGISVKITSSQSSQDSTFQRRFTYVIDLEDYAVLQFEFETYLPFGQGFPATIDSTYHSSLTYLKRRIDYTKYNEKYYLSQYYQHLKHEYRAVNSTELYTSEHQFYLVSNNIESNPQYSLEHNDKMDYRSKLESSFEENNEAFWANYNMLEQTPFDKKIISDLKKKNTSKSQSR